MDSVQSIFLDLNQLISHRQSLVSSAFCRHLDRRASAFLVMAVARGCVRAGSERIHPSNHRCILSPLQTGGRVFPGRPAVYRRHQLTLRQPDLRLADRPGLQNHPKYLWIFCIKLILVLCLLTLFLYTVIFKSDEDEEEEG